VILHGLIIASIHPNPNPNSTRQKSVEWRALQSSKSRASFLHIFRPTEIYVDFQNWSYGSIEEAKCCLLLRTRLFQNGFDVTSELVQAGKNARIVRDQNTWSGHWDRPGA
jgi:hypothetical protein